MLASNALQHQTAFARAGNHRFAQAYAKGQNRMMRAAVADEGQERVRKKYVAKTAVMYNQMAQQDCMEQLVDLGVEETMAKQSAQAM